MKKWNVTINFAIQAEDRKQAWLETTKISQRHFRDLAMIEEVSEIELLDTSQVTVVNEPIKARK